MSDLAHMTDERTYQLARLRVQQPDNAILARRRQQTAIGPIRHGQDTAARHACLDGPASHAGQRRGIRHQRQRAERRARLDFRQWIGGDRRRLLLVFLRPALLVIGLDLDAAVLGHIDASHLLALPVADDDHRQRGQAAKQKHRRGDANDKTPSRSRRRGSRNRLADR